MEVLKSLFTIFVIVTLGIGSRKTNVFSREHVKTLSAFVYYFGLPALFFTELSTLDLAALDMNIIFGSVLPIIIIIAALYILKAIGWLSKDNFILFSLSISFGGYAFFGIAFFETLYDGKWLSDAIVATSGLGIVGILLSLTLFEYANKKEQSWGFLLKTFRNPLIIAIFLGVLSAAIGFRIEVLNNALGLIGKSAGGIAIFALGIFLYDNFSVEAAKRAFAKSLFRTFSLPAVTWLLLILGMTSNPEMSRFLFLQSGIPAAISLVVFAERYEYKLAEVTGMVILTSILSFGGLIILSILSEFLF